MAGIARLRLGWGMYHVVNRVAGRAWNPGEPNGYGRKHAGSSAVKPDKRVVSTPSGNAFASSKAGSTAAPAASREGRLEHSASTIPSATTIYLTWHRWRSPCIGILIILFALHLPDFVAGEQDEIEGRFLMCFEKSGNAKIESLTDHVRRYGESYLVDDARIEIGRLQVMIGDWKAGIVGLRQIYDSNHGTVYYRFGLRKPYACSVGATTKSAFDCVGVIEQHFGREHPIMSSSIAGLYLAFGELYRNHDQTAAISILEGIVRRSDGRTAVGEDRKLYEQLLLQFRNSEVKDQSDPFWRYVFEVERRPAYIALESLGQLYEQSEGNEIKAVMMRMELVVTYYRLMTREELGRKLSQIDVLYRGLGDGGAGASECAERYRRLNVDRASMIYECLPSYDVIGSALVWPAAGSIFKSDNK